MFFILFTATRTHVQRRDSKSSIYKDNKEEESENNDVELTGEDEIPASNDESKHIDHANKNETEVIIFMIIISKHRKKTRHHNSIIKWTKVCQFH